MTFCSCLKTNCKPKRDNTLFSHAAAGATQPETAHGLVNFHTFYSYHSSGVH